MSDDKKPSLEQLEKERASFRNKFVNRFSSSNERRWASELSNFAQEIPFNTLEEIVWSVSSKIQADRAGLVLDALKIEGTGPYWQTVELGRFCESVSKADPRIRTALKSTLSVPGASTQ